MTDSNSVVQAAIAKHITGLDIAPKYIIVKDPVAKMEEVVTNQMLTEMNTDENLKEQIKQRINPTLSHEVSRYYYHIGISVNLGSQEQQ